MSSFHLATRNHMHLGVESLRNVVFDWCSGLVINMQKQLNDCKLGKNNNFEYPSILMDLFFECVPSLSPKVTLPHPHAHDPRITKSVDVLVRKGGGDILGGYDDDFHSWWIRYVPAFEQFPYVRTDFRGDP